MKANRRIAGKRAGSGTGYYHAGAQGNVTAMINSSRTVMASYQYDPFGNTLSSSGSWADANPYRFSSKRQDSYGLYSYGYRFYHPDLQRWLNRDPLGEYGGINLYGFVGNNPMSFIDPWGLEGCSYKDLRDDLLGPNGNFHDPRSGKDLTGPEVIKKIPGEVVKSAVNFTPAGKGVKAGKALNQAAKNKGFFRNLLNKLNPFKKKPIPKRAFDDILDNDDNFKRWLKSSHDPNKPLNPDDSRKVWDKLRDMGKNPRLDPPHEKGYWKCPHINVDGKHIPVDSGFTP